MWWMSILACAGTGDPFAPAPEPQSLAAAPPPLTKARVSQEYNHCTDAIIWDALPSVTADASDRDAVARANLFDTSERSPVRKVMGIQHAAVHVHFLECRRASGARTEGDRQLLVLTSANEPSRMFEVGAQHCCGGTWWGPADLEIAVHSWSPTGFLVGLRGVVDTAGDGSAYAGMVEVWWVPVEAEAAAEDSECPGWTLPYAAATAVWAPLHVMAFDVEEPSWDFAEIKTTLRWTDSGVEVTERGRPRRAYRDTTPPAEPAPNVTWERTRTSTWLPQKGRFSTQCPSP